MDEERLPRANWENEVDRIRRNRISIESEKQYMSAITIFIIWIIENENRLLNDNFRDKYIE